MASIEEIEKDTDEIIVKMTAAKAILQAHPTSDRLFNYLFVGTKDAGQLKQLSAVRGWYRGFLLGPQDDLCKVLVDELDHRLHKLMGYDYFTTESFNSPDFGIVFASQFADFDFKGTPMHVKLTMPQLDFFDDFMGNNKPWQPTFRLAVSIGSPYPDFTPFDKLLEGHFVYAPDLHGSYLDLVQRLKAPLHYLQPLADAEAWPKLKRAHDAIAEYLKQLKALHLLDFSIDEPDEYHDPFKPVYAKLLAQPDAGWLAERRSKKTKQDLFQTAVDKLGYAATDGSFWTSKLLFVLDDPHSQSQMLSQLKAAAIAALPANGVVKLPTTIKRCTQAIGTQLLKKPTKDPVYELDLDYDLDFERCLGAEYPAGLRLQQRLETQLQQL